MMTRSSHLRLWLLTASAFYLLTTSTSAQKVDCRKFVFAPICRGVAAKRSSQLAYGPPDFVLETGNRRQGALDDASTSPQRDTPSLDQSAWLPLTASEQGRHSDVVPWFMNSRRGRGDVEVTYDY